MRDPLETYIKEHRNELDSFQPSPEAWGKIDTGLNKAHFFKSTLSWLKYFVFGASVLALVIYLNLRSRDLTIIDSTEKISALNPAKMQFADSAKPFISKNDSTNELIVPLIATGIPVKNQDDMKSLPPLSVIKQTENSDLFIPATDQSFQVSNQPKPDSHNEPSFKPDTLFEGINRLEINCNNADIQVTSNSGNQIFFRKDFNYQQHGLVIGKPNHKIEYQRKDSTLIITLVNLTKSRVVIGSLTYYALLSIDIPKETELIINDSYGNVSVNDLKSATLQVKATSGNVKLENITSDMQLKLGYGNLFLKNTTGFISAELTSGDISMIDHKGNIEVKTSYGNQNYLGLTGNIKTKSISGDIKIKDMAGNATLTSEYGNVILENYKGIPSLDVLSGDISGKQIELTGNMRITSKYGNIKMAVVNPYNTLSFDLSVKYGTITIDKDGEKLLSEEKLMINNGSILIKSSSESGDQTFK